MSEAFKGTSDPDWSLANCAQTDPELFFLGEGSSEDNKQQIKQAKLICSRCDIQAACLDWALNTDEKYGIWGGLNETERSNLKEKLSSANDPKQIF